MRVATMSDELWPIIKVLLFILSCELLLAVFLLTVERYP
jgi:hypothetical protein